jgi:AcrR family transcriptional regulator
MSFDVNGVKIGVMSQPDQPSQPPRLDQSSQPGRPPKPGRRYHHGDLRNALVDAATALAREGGPEALVLREVARRTEVSAAAAYHHFASHEDLVQAVKAQSLDLLAERMRAAIAERGATAEQAASPDPAAAARRQVRNLGAAYLQFAAEEPGLYRVTFGPRGRWPAAGTSGPEPADTGPFRLLAGALDELAAADPGVASRRAGLEYVVWAAVHGIAVFLLEGPLVTAPEAQRDHLAELTLDTVIRGL